MPVPRSNPAVRLPPGARRSALLEILRERADGATVAELADAVGLHPNTVRAHLDVLVRTGRVERRPARGGTPGRPREVYTATGAPDEDRNYRVLAQMLAARLAELAPDPQTAAVEAGEAWADRTTASARSGTTSTTTASARSGTTGDDVTASDRGEAGAPTVGAAPSSAADPGLRPLLQVLTEVGFRPRLADDDRTVELHHCPFLELATERPDVVCGAHLGLIRGTLDRAGSGLEATLIVPFVRPDLCVAELEPRVRTRTGSTASTF